MMKKSALLLLCIITLFQTSYSQNFITKWDLSLPGSSPDQISFNAIIAGTGANYTWETIPAGTSGNGILNFGFNIRTISGIPAGATIRLSIEPINLQRFFIDAGPDALRLIDIEAWGTANWTSMERAFRGCENLVMSAIDAPNLSNVTNMRAMFANAISFNHPINHWNTANVTNMSSLFSSATVFNQDLSSWNTSNVTDMNSMFFYNMAFNQNIGSWNISNVTNMSQMFMLTSEFNQNIGNWNTSNVSNMSSMFTLANNFNQDIGNWDVSNVTNMSFMFSGANAFNQNLSGWNTANVTDMSFMFNSATSFNQDLGSWILSPNVDLFNMLTNNNGIDCDNYSSTLIGWQANNPTVINRTLGAGTKFYTNIAVAARNQLIIGQGWEITGDGLIASTPLVVPPYNFMVCNGVDVCESVFTNIYDRTQKLASINPNGNSIDLNDVNIYFDNYFQYTTNLGISEVVSGNSGYHQIDNGINTFRLSRRMFTVEYPGTFTQNGGVIIRFYYDLEDLGGIFTDPMPAGTISNFGWCKINNNDTENIMNGMSATAPNIQYATPITPTYGIENGVNYVEFTVESFSTFAIFAQTESAPLPYNLTSFNANCDEANINISWETASEVNASHFILQKSTDGLFWNDETTLDAKGNTSQTTKYNYVAQNTGGQSFFRLIQVDKDGKEDIFKIISVNCKENNNSMMVFPNPTSGNFSVQFETASTIENAQIELLDITGRIVKVQSLDVLSGQTTLNFETSNLPRGTYFVRLKDGNDRFKPMRVVIQ